MTDRLEAPVPLRQKIASKLSMHDMKTARSSSSSDNMVPKKLKTATDMRLLSPKRPKSAVPFTGSKNGDGSGSEEIMKQRLHFYDLDYVQDFEQHSRNIYDVNSKWFSRDVKPKLSMEALLPYQTETHIEQASYLCHILVNLYIAIRSLDIQGLISISSKDLAELGSEIDELALNTDMFRLANENETSWNDINNYDEDEDDEEQDEDDYEYDGPSFGATGKITAKSATIINVNHWTNELRNCLHFDFPISLRKKLAAVYYSLALVQGQRVYRQMHVDLFESLVTINDEDTNFAELLLEAGLVLDHEPMQKFLSEFLPSPEAEYSRFEITCKPDHQLFRLMLKLAHCAKPFYRRGTFISAETMDYYISSLAPSTAFCVLPIMTSFVPYQFTSERSIADYFPFVFTLWTAAPPSVGSDTHFYDFVGCVAEEAHRSMLKHGKLECRGQSVLKEYGLFTEAQLDFLLNRIQNHLRNDFQIVSFSRAVRPLIYSLYPSSATSFFEKIKSLLKSVETFVHPSNNGPWTKIIAKFVHGFIKLYHERVKLEQRTAKAHEIPVLTTESHSLLLDTFIDVIFLGSQNKSSDMTNYYISTIGYLLDLKSSHKELIFDKVLLDLYDCLMDRYVNSSHRLISSLKQLTKAVRYMIMEPLYRVHVTNILLMLTSKIDMNDLTLTSNIMNCIVTIFSFIPLESFIKEDEYVSFESHTLPVIEQHALHLKQGLHSDTFEYNEATLNQAFKASTTVFENITKVYLEKLFQLVDTDLEEGLISKIKQTTLIMIESMSDEILKSFVESLDRMFWDNDAFKDKEPNYELITTPLGVCARRDPAFGRKLLTALIMNIRDQINRGAGSIRSSSEIQPRDVKLLTFLTALTDVLRLSSLLIKEFSTDVSELLTFLFDKITNPPLDVHTSLILHNVLLCLTSTEVIDFRLFKGSRLDAREKWGGMQFSPLRFEKEHLDFEWHIPTADEVSLAIQLLEQFTSYCMDKVENLIEHQQNDSRFSDKLKKYILIIAHALSGSSLLFDPDFSIRQNPDSLMGYREKLLLLKKIRDKQCDGQELNIDIEQIKSEKIDGELQSSDYSDYSSDVMNEINVNFGISEENVNYSLYDDTSGAPSGIATPEPQHFSGENQSSALSGSLAFRNLDIFSCNYYFADGKAKDDPLYLKVHMLRSRLGKFFHRLFKIFSIHHEDNVVLFKILLHAIKVWFTDVGQETIFGGDPGPFLDVDFLENIQNIAHIEEPYTRTCFAVKAQVLHEARLLLRSTNRSPSRLEKVLLNDVIKMSTSLYPNIHKPAQACMAQGMKQLVGSFAMVMKQTLKLLNAALDSDNEEKVNVILEVLMIKKIQRKLFSDYENIEDLTRLLLRASKMNNLDVSLKADSVLTEISTSLKIPSSVCILDPEPTSQLKPPDSSIEQQVSAIQKVKFGKRQHYISILIQLEDQLLLVARAEHELRWKSRLLVLKMILKIQSSLEIPPNRQVLVQILEMAENKHPEIVHLSIKAILSVGNKMLSLGAYHYNLKNAYDLNFQRDELKTIKTDVKGFNDHFKTEMKNFENPSYFIDAKAFVGYLSWGREMDVVSQTVAHSGLPLFNLKSNDLKTLKIFGEKLTKKFIFDTMDILIQDNESRGIYSSANIEFFALLTALISNNLTALQFSDLLEACEKYYDKSDKASMIMSVELMAGLLMGSKNTKAADLAQRDEFLVKFIDSCLDSEFNQDSSDIWAVFCWWLPTTIDIRRCKVLFNKLTDVQNLFNKNSDASAEQASKISLLKNISASLGFRAPTSEEVLPFLTFDHPYDQVRQAIARLFATLLQTRLNPSFSSVPELLEYTSNESGLGRRIRFVPEVFHQKIQWLFDDIEKNRNEVEGLSPQEIIRTKYYFQACTALNWLISFMQSQTSGILISYLKDHIAPFLMNLAQMRELCSLAKLDPGSCYISMSVWPLNAEEVDTVMALFGSMSLKTSNEIRLHLTFLENFYSRNMLMLSASQKQLLLDYVVHYIYDEQHVEVRLRAANVLSGIVHNLREKEILEELITKFESGLGKFSLIEKRTLSKSSSEVHGSVIGLGAVISAFPYVFPLPQWIPRQLSFLASWARTSGVAGAAAKEIISGFKKVRADTWHVDRAVFTSDELEDLEGVTWRSYYA
ncbi:LAMI_0F12486g1_1 [Lachancea mirantina]|uniref:LAMI_0F12486g1_1 n=1 Tax=Lachancea mirantina TaxID=1230905 RepID=A0A1G4K368_9SACH|nr:LAMI_0F12486g1_1 [Lachancea mirantina]